MSLIYSFFIFIVEKNRGLCPELGRNVLVLEVLFEKGAMRTSELHPETRRRDLIDDAQLMLLAPASVPLSRICSER